MMKSFAPVNIDQPQRYMVVMIPDWATASLGMVVPPGALAVTAHRGRVVDATLYARRAGVRVGMRVKSAQLLVPHLLVLPADYQSEATRFETVLRALETQVAQARMVVPGVAWTLARGPARWHGGEEAAAEALIDAVSTHVGLESRVGIARGTAGALLAAQRGDLIPDGAEMQYLSAIPLAQIAALIPQGSKRYGALAAQLELLGVVTCGDLAEYDDKAYYARFGQAFGELYALARGGDVFFPDGQRYLDELQVVYECDEPEAHVERLMIPMTRLAQQMTRKLELQGVSAGAMTTYLRTQSGQEFERRWGQVDATGGDVIVQRILWHIQGLRSQLAASGDTTAFEPDENPVSDGVSTIVLRVSELCDTTMDSPLWGVAKRRVERERSIEHVSTLLGENAVLRPQMQGAFDPRSRVIFRPWGSPLAEVPSEHGAWEGKVSDPPQIICIPPTPIRMYEAPAVEVFPAKSPQVGDGAQIISFPGMPASGQREREGLLRVQDAPEGGSRTTSIPVRVDARGMLSCYHALMELEEQPAPCQLKHWSLGQRIRLTLRDPVWTVRGRWWEASDESETHAPRSYVRACTHDGVEILLVCRGRQWSIEGMYDRTPQADVPQADE